MTWVAFLSSTGQSAWPSPSRDILGVTGGRLRPFTPDSSKGARRLRAEVATGSSKGDVHRAALGDRGHAPRPSIAWDPQAPRRHSPVIRTPSAAGKSAWARRPRTLSPPSQSSHGLVQVGFIKVPPGRRVLAPVTVTVSGEGRSRPSKKSVRPPQNKAQWPTQAAGRRPARAARVSSETESHTAAVPARTAGPVPVNRGLSRTRTRRLSRSSERPVAARGLPGPAVLRPRLRPRRATATVYSVPASDATVTESRVTGAARTARHPSP